MNKELMPQMRAYYAEQYMKLAQPTAWLKFVDATRPPLTPWQLRRNRLLYPFREAVYRIGLAWRALRIGDLDG